MKVGRRRPVDAENALKLMREEGFGVFIGDGGVIMLHPPASPEATEKSACVVGYDINGVRRLLDDSESARSVRLLLPNSERESLERSLGFKIKAGECGTLVSGEEFEALRRRRNPSGGGRRSPAARERARDDSGT